jgi:hypothetical protein
MLFSIQTSVEDYFHDRNYQISDNYAIAIAKLYYRNRKSLNETDFLVRMKRIRTKFFAENKIRDRREFERLLLHALDKTYKKKLRVTLIEFPGGLEKEKREIRKQKRRSIHRLLEVFRRSVEARGIDGFWQSRVKGILHTRPEKIAQAFFGSFIYGVLDGRGVAIRELFSGIGFVDTAVIFSAIPHLVELKILNNGLTGTQQLQQYMQTEGRNEGHLLVFDARPQDHKTRLENEIETSAGKIHVHIIDINPPPPSSLN